MRADVWFFIKMHFRNISTSRLELQLLQWGLDTNCKHLITRRATIQFGASFLPKNLFCWLVGVKMTVTNTDTKEHLCCSLCWRPGDGGMIVNRLLDEPFPLQEGTLHTDASLFLFFIFRGHTWWRMNSPTCPLWGRLYSRFSHSLFGSTSPVVLRLWLRELELWWLQWSWVKWICELSVLVCQCHWASGFTLQRCDIALLTGLSEMQSVSFYYYYCVISLFCYFFCSGETVAHGDLRLEERHACQMWMIWLVTLTFLF